MYSDRDDLTAGFPHSDIHGSKPARGSPWLFAACHVLHRLLAPRHPPNALLILAFSRPRSWRIKKQPIRRQAASKPQELASRTSQRRQFTCMTMTMGCQSHANASEGDQYQPCTTPKCQHDQNDHLTLFISSLVQERYRTKVQLPDDPKDRLATQPRSITASVLCACNSSEQEPASTGNWRPQQEPASTGNWRPLVDCFCNRLMAYRMVRSQLRVVCSSLRYGQTTLVEAIGIEPTTYGLQSRRSPS